MNIRAFKHSEHDYKNLTAIWDSIHANYPLTIEQIKFNLKNTPQKIKWQTFFVEQNNKTIAQGNYHNYQSGFHPQKFRLSISVLPDYRCQGIATQLYKECP